MVSIALAGYGYWGRNLARNFFALPNCNLHSIVELDSSKVVSLPKLLPSTHHVTDFKEVLKSKDIDAVVIATHVSSHYALAKLALEAGKHVLIEKPMASTVKECEKLIAIARSSGLVIMPDHTFLYTGAVQKMKQLVESGEIGNINYIDSTRINLGLFQQDVNVLWDLAPHDISICDYLLGQSPVSVQATGKSHTNNGIENIAYLTLNYSSGVIAHFSCSWSSPVKIRQLLVGGEKKMILFNDMEPTEKIKVYDTGYSIKSDEDKSRILVDYRIGDIHVPKISMTEALSSMASDFIKSIEEKTWPISNFEIGINVVRVLEASQISIKQNGKEIIF